MRKALVAAIVAVLLTQFTFAQTVHSFGPFDVTFLNDGQSNEIATSEQDWTQQQIDDVAAAINTWSQGILNTSARQIQMHVLWADLSIYGSGTLGASGSVVVSNGTTMYNRGEYVWKTGNNASLVNYSFDTIIMYDYNAAGLSWNFGSQNPDSSQIDFRSVITHEIGHSLGWASSYDYEYDDWGWFNGKNDALTDWDRNLVDSQGNKPEVGTSGTPGNFNETDNPVYWDGQMATDVYGQLVPIYAPSFWQPGSSLSHLDEKTFPGFLMSPFIAPGESVREISELEWAMMKDMNWSVVPEPASILLLAIGTLLIRKKRQNTL